MQKGTKKIFIWQNAFRLAAALESASWRILNEVEVRGGVSFWLLFSIKKVT
jgi:hypothetical protein